MSAGSEHEEASAGGATPDSASPKPTRTTKAPVVVELEGAISLINRFPALAGVDLKVDEGEIVLLRGPNGAGKTTLLRLCAGLAPLSEGRGTVLGHQLDDRAVRRSLRRQTGLLAHNTFLYDELTVEENLHFWAKANRIDSSSIEPVLDRLALGTRLRSVKVANLSAGQRRRTSLAVLVVRRPRLWLLDEPHAGLDVNGRDFVDDLVRHAVAFGATVLFASHDFDRATEIASRTVVVAGGRIQTSGNRPSAGAHGGGRVTPTDDIFALGDGGGPSWLGAAYDGGNGAGGDEAGDEGEAMAGDAGGEGEPASSERPTEKG
ncbi:MAG: heme ABC exporter ATP-binding protein CcmA [Actinomycetota bacterium]